MEQTENELRDTIIRGWTGMAFILLWMFVASLMQSAIRQNFNPLSNHVQTFELVAMTIYICINVLMQISIKQVNAKGFRWFAFGIVVIYAMTFVGHHLQHIIVYEERFNLNTVLNLTHHIAGASAAVATYRWARSASSAPAAVPDTSFAPARPNEAR
jgi:hypothetical protein